MSVSPPSSPTSLKAVGGGGEPKGCYEPSSYMTDKCIEFKGAKDKKGYGVLWYKDKPEKAHRIAYSLYNGPLHWSLTVDHLCRNHACINPKHLEAVPNRVNVLRGVGLAAQNATKTHCIRGHEFIGDNVRVNKSPNGRQRRTCRVCIRNKNKHL